MSREHRKGDLAPLFHALDEARSPRVEPTGVLRGATKENAIISTASPRTARCTDATVIPHKAERLKPRKDEEAAASVRRKRTGGFSSSVSLYTAPHPLLWQTSVPGLVGRYQKDTMVSRGGIYADVRLAQPAEPRFGEEAIGPGLTVGPCV